MARRKNKFAYADDIYFTKKSIAVRKIYNTISKNGISRLVDKTRYYPKSKRNINQALRVYGQIKNGRYGGGY